jgi:hypothetical protein
LPGISRLSSGFLGQQLFYRQCLFTITDIGTRQLQVEMLRRQLAVALFQIGHRIDTVDFIGVRFELLPALERLQHLVILFGVQCDIGRTGRHPGILCLAGSTDVVIHRLVHVTAVAGEFGRQDIEQQLTTELWRLRLVRQCPWPAAAGAGDQPGQQTGHRQPPQPGREDILSHQFHHPSIYRCHVAWGNHPGFGAGFFRPPATVHNPA